VSILREVFPIEPLAPTSLDEWVMIANQNNLDVKAARLNMESREYEADAAKAAMLPTLDLSAGYTWVETGGINFFNLVGGGGDAVNDNSQYHP